MVVLLKLIVRFCFTEVWWFCGNYYFVCWVLVACVVSLSVLPVLFCFGLITLDSVVFYAYTSCLIVWQFSLGYNIIEGCAWLLC